MPSLLMLAYKRREAARRKQSELQRPAARVRGGRGSVPGDSGALSLSRDFSGKASVDAAQGAPGGVARGAPSLSRKFSGKASVDAARGAPGGVAQAGGRTPTGTLVEGGAAPVSGINLARAGY